MPVVYSPKDKIYFRVNPTDDRELQWTNQLSSHTHWQRSHTFSVPILALDVDDDSGRAVIITHKGSHRDYFISSGAQAFNRISFPSNNRIVVAYKF